MPTNLILRFQKLYWVGVCISAQVTESRGVVLQ